MKKFKCVSNVYDEMDKTEDWINEIIKLINDGARSPGVCFYQELVVASKRLRKLHRYSLKQ